METDMAECDIDKIHLLSRGLKQQRIHKNYFLIKFSHKKVTSYVIIRWLELNNNGDYIQKYKYN